MIIGVPKEIKTDENRVGLTPAGVHEFYNHGHKILIEKNAGLGSGFSDIEYKNENLANLKTYYSEDSLLNYSTIIDR